MRRNESRAPTRVQEWVGHATALAWLCVFLWLVILGASPAPPSPQAFPALAATGLLYGVTFRREALARVFYQHRLLLGASIAFVVGVLAVEGWMHAAELPGSEEPLPVQLGMLLCIAPLALVLQSPRLLRLIAVLFAALCLWHVVALPVEAVTGTRLGGLGLPLNPRPWGPFEFQGAGLAWQVYFFAGLYLAMFYFAVGLASEESLWPGLVLPLWQQFVLGCVWIGAIAALQSRSAFFGAALATSITAFAGLHTVPLRRRVAVVAMLAVAAAVLYGLLFSGGKSPFGLRWAYLKLFVERSLQWPQVLTGRSYTVVPYEDMGVTGMQFLPHSHNDLVQILFFWGLPVLLLYLLFWGALLRLVWTGFWQQQRRWPMLAIVAVAPGFMTDLGFHIYEKAAFMVVLAGLCMALAGPRVTRPA